MKTFIITALSFFLLAACTKETVSPLAFGDIEGTVLDSKSNEAIENVLITTTPATNSILTNPDGSFHLNEVPTGSYSISAERENFGTKSVEVMVKEDRTASAQIFLKELGSTSQSFNAAVTSWNQFEVRDTTNQVDSVFVTVNYEVENMSLGQTIDQYEVYFKIYTNGPVFFKEIRDSSLAAGERDFNEFTRHIEKYTTDSVRVTGNWISNID